jgi:hypothetical protein
MGLHPCEHLDTLKNLIETFIIRAMRGGFMALAVVELSEFPLNIRAYSGFQVLSTTVRSNRRSEKVVESWAVVKTCVL